ncbi:hypothetical protein J3R83DRAFT_11543, partial [Lanmaoa asiatica]
HVELVPPNAARDALTYSEPERSSLVDQLPDGAPTDLFESVVVTEVDGDSPPHVLRAAALDHVRKKG